MTEASRDRAADGRALNARPRDALGRPLPRGAPGVPRIADDATFSPTEALDTAQRLIDDGYAFHAHEVLESAWKTAPPENRWLWRALAQIAVGLTHVARGNRRGAVALLQRGAAGLAESDGRPAAPFGVDVDGILAHVRDLVDDLSAHREVEPDRLRIVLIGPSPDL